MPARDRRPSQRALEVREAAEGATDSVATAASQEAAGRAAPASTGGGTASKRKQPEPAVAAAELAPARQLEPCGGVEHLRERDLDARVARKEARRAAKLQEAAEEEAAKQAVSEQRAAARAAQERKAAERLQNFGQHCAAQKERQQQRVRAADDTAVERDLAELIARMAPSDLDGATSTPWRFLELLRSAAQSAIGNLP